MDVPPREDFHFQPRQSNCYRTSLPVSTSKLSDIGQHAAQNSDPGEKGNSWGTSRECLAVCLRILFWWLQHNELESQHTTVVLLSWRGREQSSGSLVAGICRAGQQREGSCTERVSRSLCVDRVELLVLVREYWRCTRKYLLQGWGQQTYQRWSPAGDEGGPAQLEWGDLASTSVILQASNLDTREAHLRSKDLALE